MQRDSNRSPAVHYSHAETERCGMRQKINNVLNIIMESFVGVWIGHGIFTYWDYKTHPDLYFINSAPWYTSTLIYGAVVLAILAICILIKFMIRKGMKNSSGSE